MTSRKKKLRIEVKEWVTAFSLAIALASVFLENCHTRKIQDGVDSMEARIRELQNYQRDFDTSHDFQQIESRFRMIAEAIYYSHPNVEVAKRVAAQLTMIEHAKYAETATLPAPQSWGGIWGLADAALSGNTEASNMLQRLTKEEMDSANKRWEAASKEILDLEKRRAILKTKIQFYHSLTVFFQFFAILLMAAKESLSK